jgi:N-methylhydantoinase A
VTASPPTFSIGIDTGGTFTDAFIADDGSGHWTVKVPTTPHDLTVCFSDAIDGSAQAVGLTRHGLLRRTAVIRFSSTIATNTALTRSGPKLGVLVTDSARPALYGLAGTADEARLLQFVPPDMITGIRERMSPDARGRLAPAADEVVAAVRGLLERGARLLVVCLAGSAANPAHEAAVARVINDSYPRHYLGAVPVLLSTDVSAAVSDADRLTAAVVNGYLHRRLATSLYKAEDDLRASGLTRPLLIVTADGSVARVAKTRALDTYQSGPAAGVHGGALLARSYGLDAALTADVGGTSTDFGLVVAGRPVRRQRIDVAGLQIAQPAVELYSVALGGGSIVSVTDGALAVGPGSAGAAPGPACFGLGGTDPTPTDAWLVLGYLDPANYLGGRRVLFPELAADALSRAVGAPLALSAEEAALAVQEAAEREAARGITQMLARPAARAALGGRRPGDLALICYGGGGGCLLPPVAARAGLGAVYLPALSPVYSAFGVSTFDVEHSYQARMAPAQVADGLDGLVAAAERDARGEGFDPGAVAMTVSVLADDGTVLADDLEPGQAAAAVRRLAAAPAGAAGADAGLLVRLRATCRVPAPGIPGQRAAGAPPARAQTGERAVLLPGGRQEVPVYARDLLGAGHELTGPCVIESAGSTYLIPSGATCRIDQLGTAILTNS